MNVGKISVGLHGLEQKVLGAKDVLVDKSSEKVRKTSEKLGKSVHLVSDQAKSVMGNIKGNVASHKKFKGKKLKQSSNHVQQASDKINYITEENQIKELEKMLNSFFINDKKINVDDERKVEGIINKLRALEKKYAVNLNPEGKLYFQHRKNQLAIRRLLKEADKLIEGMARERKEYSLDEGTSSQAFATDYSLMQAPPQPSAPDYSLDEGASSQPSAPDYSFVGDDYTSYFKAPNSFFKDEALKIEQETHEREAYRGRMKQNLSDQLAKLFPQSQRIDGLANTLVETIEENKSQWISDLEERVQHGKGEENRLSNIYLKKELINTPFTIELIKNKESGNIKILIHFKKKAKTYSGANKVMHHTLDYGSEMEFIAQLQPKSGQSQTSINDIKEEANISMKFSGKPGCAECYGYSTHSKKGGDQIHMFTKFYPEGDLKNYLKNHSIDTQEAAEIALKALIGVDSVHQEGYIHKDLHFGNYFIDIDEEGELHILLSDFGGSKHIDSENDSKWPEGFMNFLLIPPEIVEYVERAYLNSHYLFPPDMSATQLASYPKQFDVWCLGLMFYELYYKQDPPWAHLTNEGGKNIQQDPALAISKFQQAQNEMLQFSKKEPQDIHSFEHLIWEMLNLSPEQRPKIEEVKNRLEKINKSMDLKGKGKI